MVPFSVTILGSNSAIPTLHRKPTSQLLNLNERLYLIDCGEGTQVELRRNHVKFLRIKAIFISHMHGDHYFGLIGLLNSMHLLGRTKPLVIVAPEELKRIIHIQLLAANTRLSFEWEFRPLTPNSHTVVFEDSALRVQNFPVKHRIPCHGYLFKEQEREPHMKKEMIAKYSIPAVDIVKIKKGGGFALNDGTYIPHEKLTTPNDPPRSYAFCTDTLPLPEELPKYTKGANLMYHEATFLNDQEDRAKKTYHSTAVQAAKVAKACAVDQLILGHFSTRYTTLDTFLTEAKPHFENTDLALEGRTFEIG